MDEFIKYREQLDLSQLELSQKLGVSRSLIAAIESGNRKPTAKLLKKLKDLVENQNTEGGSNNDIGTIKEWRDKYMSLLEDYKALSDKLNDCMTEKEAIHKEYKSNPGKVSKHVSK